MKHIIFILLALSIFASCKKENMPINTEETSFQFYPVTPGTERIYKVTHIAIDLMVDKNDTTVFYLKETVLDTIIDTLNYQMYVIKQEVRDSLHHNWEENKQIAIKKYKRWLGLQEDNVETLILKFPESIDREWDANEYNSLDAETYEYIQLAAIDSVFENRYDSVLVVEIDNFESIVSYNFEEDRYQFGVGLIEQTKINIESQSSQHPLGQVNFSEPIMERITLGTQFKKELISYSIPE